MIELGFNAEEDFAEITDMLVTVQIKNATRSYVARARQRSIRSTEVRASGSALEVNDTVWIVAAEQGVAQPLIGDIIGRDKQEWLVLDVVPTVKDSRYTCFARELPAATSVTGYGK